MERTNRNPRSRNTSCTKRKKYCCKSQNWVRKNWCFLVIWLLFDLRFLSLLSLPILQRILTNPNSRAIIVCPSRELCAQTYQFLKILTSRCSDFISLYELGNETDSDDVIGASIVMGTPGRLVKAIKGNRLVMKDVAVLVLDEGTGYKSLNFDRF